MTDQTTQVRLTLDAGPEADLEELAELTQQLRGELLDLDVEAVDLVSAGDSPAKAKGDPITWGMLGLTFVSGGGLVALINLLQTWLIRHGPSSVTVKLGDDEITVTDRPTEQQQQVINTWLRRHRGFEIANE
jgi:hypothetical protein